MKSNVKNFIIKFWVIRIIVIVINLTKEIASI